MLAEHLVIGVRGRFWVRVQDVILTPDEGWRSPDLLVVPREDEERADRALLVVEVANTSRGRDDQKAAVYAEVGVAEYWIVDVDRDEVLVHREPRDNAYASVERWSRATPSPRSSTWRRSTSPRCSSAEGAPRRYAREARNSGAPA